MLIAQNVSVCILNTLIWVFIQLVGLGILYTIKCWLVNTSYKIYKDEISIISEVLHNITTIEYTILLNWTNCPDVHIDTKMSL